MPISKECVSNYVICHAFYQCCCRVATLEVQINTNEKVQGHLINRIESLERIIFQRWEDKSKGGCEAQATQLQGEISYLVNHCILLFLQGSQYLFSPPRKDGKAEDSSLIHTICHQSHSPQTISASVFHPLSLSSPINLILLLSLTAAIHSVCSTSIR